MNFDLADFDAARHDIPLLVDLQPSGRFLMEEFHYAGGIPAVLHRIREKLHLHADTVSGSTIGEIASSGASFNDDVIRPLANPVKSSSGLWVLFGNLCPDGAIVKPSAASERLLNHTGRAIVFENIEDLREKIDHPALEIDGNSILLLKGCGPKGYPGMPEVGNMPLPKKLLASGIDDILRISDARMSGTAYGTVIPHVAPEAAAGGILGLVESGDTMHFDGWSRKLDLRVDDETLQRRLEAWKSNGYLQAPVRGYTKLFVDHVLQANDGCDFDFLLGASGDDVARESH